MRKLRVISMYNNMKILALIAARGDSKGLPNKSILNLGNKPVITWTIEQAKECTYIDNVIVSTDSNAIADIARQYGANVPFMRPQILASDSSKIMDVIIHAITSVESMEKKYDILVLLQPTCPLRKASDITKAIEIYFDKKAEAVVSVTETEHNPLWANILPADRCMSNFIRPDVLNKNRQELPTYYRLNGSIYISSFDYIRRNKSFFGEKAYAYVMPRERSIDIDSIVDFLHVKAIMEHQETRQ